MQLTANFSGQNVTYRKVDSTNRDLRYVLPDWQTERWGYQPRPATPDPGIFPISPTAESWPQTDFCWFPGRWQWFHCDLLAMQAHGVLLRELAPVHRSVIISVWSQLTKNDIAYLNNHGTDVYNNYPMGQTNRGEDPKCESLITCGDEENGHPNVVGFDQCIHHPARLISKSNPQPASMRLAVMLYNGI